MRLWISSTRLLGGKCWTPCTISTNTRSCMVSPTSTENSSMLSIQKENQTPIKWEFFAQNSFSKIHLVTTIPLLILLLLSYYVFSFISSKLAIFNFFWRQNVSSFFRIPTTVCLKKWTIQFAQHLIRSHCSSPQVLGLSHDASPTQIKATCRRLFRQYHPDKVQGEAAKEAAGQKFIEVQAACQVLDKLRARRMKNSATSTELWLAAEEWSETVVTVCDIRDMQQPLCFNLCL